MYVCEINGVLRRSFKKINRNMSKKGKLLKKKKEGGKAKRKMEINIPPLYGQPNIVTTYLRERACICKTIPASNR